jgi:hypothetical protein
MINPRTKWLLLTIIVQLIIIVLIFGDVVIHPGLYFFEVGNEAYKNYLIPAYYVTYDTGLHYSGMDYPYGEHPLFTDCQLPITYCLQLLQREGFNIGQYVPGIFNMLMLLSFLPCAGFLFLILTEFGLKNWYSMLSAIGITMLSPQVVRMTGHFSLSYLFYIPMIWYFMLRFEKSRAKWKWLLLVFLFNLLFALIHLYYLVIILLFQFLYLVVSGIELRKKRLPYLRNGAMLLLSSVIPLLLVQFFIIITSPFEDRIEYPWGFFFSYASFNSVYLPPRSNLLNFLHLKNGFWEGYAYVGVVGWTASIVLITKLIRKWIRKTSHFLIFPDSLRWSFYASFLVFLFSCALPFKLGLEFLVEWLGPPSAIQSHWAFCLGFLLCFFRDGRVLLISAHKVVFH